MVLLKYLLPLFFIIFAFGEILRPRFGTATVGVIDICLVLILLCWVLFVKKKKKYNLLKPIIIFIFFAAFSLLINLTSFTQNQIINSSMYLVRFILYSGIYFTLIDLGKSINPKISRYIFVSSILIITFGFLQLFFYPSLKNLYYLGYDEHMYRMFGSFLDPNFLGIFLVLGFIFTFVLKDKLLPAKYQYLVWIYLILDFIALILTFSRGAILMFVVSAIIYAAILKKWKIAVGVVVGLVLIFTLISPLFYLENINPFRFASTFSRIQSSQKAVEIFQKKPMGIGFNTYRYARERFGDPDLAIYGPSHAGAGVDNSYALILVTTGFIGFATYLYLLFRILRLGLGEVKKNPYGLILIMSLGGLMVNALFINSLLYGFVMIWIWILAALTENNLRE